MVSESNDPRLGSAARPYKSQVVSRKDRPVNYYVFVAVTFGVLGGMFRYRACSWLAIIFSVLSVANTRNIENDLKHITMAMMFGIMGLMTSYMGLLFGMMGVGPTSNPKRF